ncbi:phage tail assembly chaperone [Pseudomonas sp. NUPR-001]|uniref:phage tail assembly chaperone n=1 Tax=Pseudomonas sp. NUPR-001 TaxID=3416058 RepID=UPI003F965512
MWARVENGIVMEVTDIDPEGRFHPDLKWWPCSAEVLPGWLFENDVFSERVAGLSELATAERQWRDGELASRQWLRDRHRDEQEISRPTTLSSEQFMDLLAYLQTLRDWPQSQNFPDVELRPTAPLWLAEHIQ